MALRKFVDADGIAWEAWEVYPEPAERRLRERRVAVQAIDHADRRAVADRRKLEESRSLLPPELARGWLAFHSAMEKRRYWPIPPDWRANTAEQLARLCASARIVGGPGTAAEGAWYPPTESDLTPPWGVEQQ